MVTKLDFSNQKLSSSYETEELQIKLDSSFTLWSCFKPTLLVYKTAAKTHCQYYYTIPT